MTPRGARAERLVISNGHPREQIFFVGAEAQSSAPALSSSGCALMLLPRRERNQPRQLGSVVGHITQEVRVGVALVDRAA